MIGTPLLHSRRQLLARLAASDRSKMATSDQLQQLTVDDFAREFGRDRVLTWRSKRKLVARAGPLGSIWDDDDDGRVFKPMKGKHRVRDNDKGLRRTGT